MQVRVEIPDHKIADYRRLLAESTTVAPEFYSNCAVETLVSQLVSHGESWLKFQAQRRAGKHRRPAK
jgi:hypothetical protein